MKYALLIPLLFVSVLNSMGQATPPRPIPLGTYKGVPTGFANNDMVNADWKTRTIEAGVLWGTYNGVNGNAFYNEEWSKGYIFFHNSSARINVTLNFNIYTNEIYFLRDSLIRVLAASEPLEEFGINQQDEDSANIIVFRCGYPATGNNTDKTFYEVLVKNKISLLKHYNKRIMERNNSLGVPEKIFIDSENFYVYDAPENKITEIKKNKNSLLTALPGYATKIQSVMDQKNLKLKKEEELITLFMEINK